MASPNTVLHPASFTYQGITDFLRCSIFTWGFMIFFFDAFQKSGPGSISAKSVKLTPQSQGPQRRVLTNLTFSLPFLLSCAFPRKQQTLKSSLPPLHRGLSFWKSLPFSDPMETLPGGLQGLKLNLVPVPATELNLRDRVWGDVQ